MTTHTTGCLVCGNPIEYFERTKSLKCELCGSSFEANAACSEGHYICDGCHVRNASDHIAACAFEALSASPILIASEMMKTASVNMHGPEHHYLIAASLLAAYRNAGGTLDFEKCMRQAKQRAEQVPGGICGLWGSCGAGIGTGIFISIVTGATPLSIGEWSLSNLMTSKSLADIAANGGPRCCKRNTFIAIRSAVKFVKEHFNIQMEDSDIKCAFHQKNNECKKSDCVFYPG